MAGAAGAAVLGCGISCFSAPPALPPRAPPSRRRPCRPWPAPFRPSRRRARAPRRARATRPRAHRRASSRLLRRRRPWGPARRASSRPSRAGQPPGTPPRAWGAGYRASPRPRRAWERARAFGRSRAAASRGAAWAIYESAARLDRRRAPGAATAFPPGAKTQSPESFPERAAFPFRECAFRRLSWISRISLCSARRRAGGSGPPFRATGGSPPSGRRAGARRQPPRRGCPSPPSAAAASPPASGGGRGRGLSLAPSRLTRRDAEDSSAGLGLRAGFLPPVAVRPLRVPLQRARAVWLSELRSLELLGGRHPLSTLSPLSPLWPLSPRPKTPPLPAPGAGAGAGLPF